MIISELSFLEQAYSLKKLIVGKGSTFDKSVINIDVLVDVDIDISKARSYVGTACTDAYFPGKGSPCTSIYKTPSGEVIGEPYWTGDPYWSDDLYQNEEVWGSYK